MLIRKLCLSDKRILLIHKRCAVEGAQIFRSLDNEAAKLRS